MKTAGISACDVAVGPFTFVVLVDTIRVSVVVNGGVGGGDFGGEDRDAAAFGVFGGIGNKSLTPFILTYVIMLCENS